MISAIYLSNSPPLYCRKFISSAAYFIPLMLSAYFIPLKLFDLHSSPKAKDPFTITNDPDLSDPKSDDFMAEVWPHFWNPFWELRHDILESPYSLQRTSDGFRWRSTTICEAFYAHNKYFLTGGWAGVGVGGWDSASSSSSSSILSRATWAGLAFGWTGRSYSLTSWRTDCENFPWTALKSCTLALIFWFLFLAQNALHFLISA